MKVLIIDTFKSELQEARAILEKAGFRALVPLGTHGEARLCLGLAGDPRTPFDIQAILLDITVGGDAFELFHALKAHAFYRHVPVVMTARGESDETLAKAFALGADDFIRKPYASLELTARLRRALKTREETTRRLALAGELFEAGEEMAQLKRQLTSVMLIDPQTALVSRRCFDERLSAEWRRAQDTTKPLAVVSFGIDAFGQYNDQFGHEAGDALLRQVARSAQKRLTRPGDTLSRLSGGVFLVLLPETGIDEALIVAENIRQGVSSEAIRCSEKAARENLVTLSSGVVATDLVEVTAPGELIQHAGKGLEEARANGGNRIRIWPSTPLVNLVESA